MTDETKLPPLPFSPYIVAEWAGPEMTERKTWTAYNREQMQEYAISALAAQGGEPRTPDGYAHMYPDGFIRHHGGRDWNGMRPLHEVPYYYGKPPVPVERGEDDELRLFERRNADFVDALPRKIEGSNLTQPAAHVSIDKAKLIELISASLDAAEIIQSDIRSEGARVTDALPELRTIMEDQSGSREEALVSFFRTTGSAMGRHGDAMGWTPEQTANHFLGESK